MTILINIYIYQSFRMAILMTTLMAKMAKLMVKMAKMAIGQGSRGLAKLTKSTYPEASASRPVRYPGKIGADPWTYNPPLPAQKSLSVKANRYPAFQLTPLWLRFWEFKTMDVIVNE
jgi:hypothetical protein